jgi:hypothetical protein
MAIYVNGVFIKQGKFSLKLSGNAEQFCKEIMANRKDNGSFRFEIKERKEADKNGNTHYITVDEWEPVKKESKDKPNDSFVEEDNSLPF